MLTKHTTNHNLGALQQHCLDFAQKYPGWHGYSPDATTQRVIDSLVKRGLVEVNEYRQFKARKQEEAK